MHTNLLDRPIKKQAASGDPTSPDAAISPSGEIKARVRTLTGNVTFYRQVESLSDGDRHQTPVGLSDVRISRNAENLKPENRSPKGFNGMSKMERELLEDGLVCLWMAKQAQRRLRLVFLTLTIPTRYADGEAISETDHRRILASWSDIVNRFNEEWCREAERHGIPKRYLYAIEPQEERWKDTGVFAPHMHLVALNKWDDSKKHPRFDQGAEASGYYSITTDDVDAIASRVYSNVLGRLVDCSASTNLASVGKLSKLYYYLSKLGRIGRYITKGSQIMGEVRASSWSSCIPHSWGGSDRQTRQTVRASEERYVVGCSDLGTAKLAVENINEAFEEKNGYPLFSTPHLVTVPSDRGDMAVALVFRVRNLPDISVAQQRLSELDLCTFRGVLVTDYLSC